MTEKYKVKVWMDIPEDEFILEDWDGKDDFDVPTPQIDGEVILYDANGNELGRKSFRDIYWASTVARRLLKKVRRERLLEKFRRER